MLEDALEAAHDGRGGVIGIVAEPGIGKSRLCHELAERCRNRGVEVYEAQAQAHGQAIPFMPILQMMRGYFGIEDRDSDRVAREKVAGRLLLLDQSFCGRPAAGLRVPRSSRPRSTAAAAGQRRSPPAGPARR